MTPQFEQLTELRLRWGGAGLPDPPSTFRPLTLADAPLQSSRTLHLEEQSFDDESIRILTQEGRCERLTKLNLFSNRITPAGLQAIAESPRLERLNLSRNRRLDNSLADILPAVRFARHLQVLKLEEVDLSPHALRKIIWGCHP